MLKRLKVILVCLLLVCIHYRGRAQQDLTFKNYSVEQGLVSNTIWSINQDAQGYMWFGTKNGLSRFDGYEFKSYQFSTNSKGTLGSNFIHAVFRYDENTLWIGTTRGIYILDLQKDSFRHFKPMKNYLVYDIQKDSNGVIWIGTQPKGLFKYDPSDKSIKNINASLEAPYALSSNEIRKLAIDNEGNIWIGTFETGIDVLNPRDNKVKHYNRSNSGLGSNAVLTVYKDFQGRMWAGTFGGGLNLWQPETGKFKNFSNASKNSINDNIVRSIYQASPGKLLIGTEQGLNVLDLGNMQFKYYTHDTSNPNGISGNAVYSIFSDREGGIWLGTYFGGLSYFEKSGSGFEDYYPTSAENTLNGGAVSSFLEDGPGKFWIGTEDGGLSYFDSEKKTFKQYPFEPEQEPLSYHNIHSLYKDKKGRIWIGTFSGGLNILDKNTGKVKIYKHDPGDPNSLSSDNVFCIYEDREGKVWIGTTKGLNVYDVKTESFRRVKKNGMGHTFVYDIYEDETGTIWFATVGRGLMGKRKKSNEWSQYLPKDEGGEFDLGSIICMADGHAGNLWLGTEERGLVKFNFGDKSFEVLDKKYGIKANVVYDIQQDDDRTLWISTNNGLYHFNPQTKEVNQFTEWDNLQSRQFNYNAGYKASDGKMFFGGIKGFNAFYPDSVEVESMKSNVVLTNFQLFNKDVSIHKDNKLLSNAINYTNHLTLSHKQSVMSFEYAAVNFEAPTKIKYAYKMDGFDKGWNYVDFQRKATYTNLPPGDYTFMVKATSDKKDWDVPVTKLGITIKPPFYLHPIAYFIYFILIIVLFVFGRKFIIERAEKRNRIRLERLSVEQEKEFYNQKIEFFTTMAHEIRTPLSLITAPLEKLMESKSLPKHVSRQLEIMNKNSDRLINLVNQLLDFRRIESDIYEIHKEELDLVVFIQSIYSRFSAMKYQEKVHFTLSTKVSNLLIKGDTEALTKIFNNLLINAFKFTRSEVRLSIQEPFVDQDGKRYSLTTIKDDGPGIPETELENIFKKYFKVPEGNSPYSNLIGTGIGLSLAKSLIEKHGGRLEVTSIPNVNTVFKVYLPYEETEENSGFNEIVTGQSESSEEEEIVEIPEATEGTVLVVEDDLSLLDFFEQNLIQERYRVLKAVNGAEALEILKDNEIDLILSDVMMPEIDGLEMCRIIKNNSDYSHIPIVLLTAKTNSEAEIKGIQHGADAYISKPFKWKHVMAVIRNLLRSRAKLKEKFASHPFIQVDSLTDNEGDKKLLEKITAIIEERITDPKLSVEELSRELAMSRSSLHKKLKSVSGKVPNEFIRLVRLKHSAKLLLKNEYTISEIGYMSGFNSHSYFSKCFYKQFKITPTEFLEKNFNTQES